MAAITHFLEGTGRDAAGRSIAQVLGFGLGDLERHHDFIQWLFPLPEPSAAVPSSPVLTSTDVEAIRTSKLAQKNLSAAIARMVWFYSSTDHWLRGPNHNHLRITRIIRSVRLLKGDAEANAFRQYVLGRAGAPTCEVSAETRAYWAAA